MKINEIILLLGLAFILYEFLSFTEKFLHTDPYLDELHAKLMFLHPKLKHVKVFGSNESYTMNKSRVYICARDENGDYYPENMLVYVLCHEYAHVACPVVDSDNSSHSKEFYVIFNKFLDEVATKGLYDPSIPPIDNYCSK